MGYRSDVRVMTDLKGFEKMQDIIWKLKEEKSLSDKNVMFPVHGADPEEYFEYYDAQEDYLCFGFDWVKWYDDYTDVALFMDMLEVADKEGINWQFMRVGEDCGDIDNFSSKHFYDNNPSAVMGAVVEITY